MGFLGGLQIQHWTDLLCASCGIKHQTRLGWVRVAECISVSVYMRVCIRCPFNQLSESQQSAALEGYVRRDPQQSDYQGEDFVVFSQPA